MMHEKIDWLEMSKTDYRFEAKNKSIFIEEIPLFVDYSDSLICIKLYKIDYLGYALRKCTVRQDMDCCRILVYLFLYITIA